MRRFRNQSGRSGLAARRSRARASAQGRKNAGIAMGMMAASGVDGKFGPMAPSSFRAQSGMGRMSDRVGTEQSTFKGAAGLALGGDNSAGEFDDIL